MHLLFTVMIGVPEKDADTYKPVLHFPRAFLSLFWPIQVQTLKRYRVSNVTLSILYLFILNEISFRYNKNLFSK